MPKALTLLGVAVVGTCAAAIYAVTPKHEPLALEFTSHALGRTVRYECSDDDGVEECLRAAGAELCGDARFEIVENRPITFDTKGRPLLSYRCFRKTVL